MSHITKVKTALKDETILAGVLNRVYGAENVRTNDIAKSSYVNTDKCDFVVKHQGHEFALHKGNKDSFEIVSDLYGARFGEKDVQERIVPEYTKDKIYAEAAGNGMTVSEEFDEAKQEIVLTLTRW